MYNQKNIRQPDYSKMTLREELEARFKQLEAEEARRKKEQSLIPQPDYSKMSLREELEARFAEMEKQEKAKQQTLGPKILPKQEPNIWDNFQSTAAPIAAGAQGFAQGAYEAGQDVVNQLYQGGEAFGNAVAQGQNIITEFKDNYFSPRNTYNRYKTGCTPSNIAYNTISSIKQLPTRKPMYSVFAPVQRFDLTPLKNMLLNSNRYTRVYKTGENICEYGTSLYNALDEANCL